MYAYMSGVTNPNTQTLRLWPSVVVFGLHSNNVRAHTSWNVDDAKCAYDIDIGQRVSGPLGICAVTN
jgi:hypothetical protein